jgi:hypothetical protein
MSNNRRANRNNRNNRNQGESDAFNRLAAILERNTTPPIAAPKPPYSIKQFTACNPPKYTGDDGATALLQWFESIESSFIVTECPDHLKVRYATTVLTKRALTWWNGQKIIYGIEELAELEWIEFKSLLLDEFCPDNEIAKLEEEFSGLKQIGGDNKTYTNRFHELSLLVPHQVTPEFRAVKKYIKGLPIEVRNHVTVTRPDTVSSAIRMAATITDNYVEEGTLTITKKAKRETPTESKTEPKTEEPKHKKTKSTRNYAITAPTPQANPTYTYSTQQPTRQFQSQTNESQTPRRAYTGTLPLCANCTFHHPTNATCRLCTTCNRLGHYAYRCRINPLFNPNPIPINTIAPTPLIVNAQPARSCYNCGDPNHFKNVCPKLQALPAPQLGHNHAFTLATTQAQVCPLNQLTAPKIPTPQQNQDQAFVQRPGKAPEGTSDPCPNQAPDFYDYVMNS